MGANIGEGVSAIIRDVVGGGIIAGGTLACGWLWRRFQRRRFRRVFGEDSIGQMYLKYCVYEPTSREVRFRKPKTKVKRGTPDAFNLTRVASGAGSRAVAYVASVIGINSNGPPIIEADDHQDERMDISFITIGGTNHRTQDIFDDESNVFLQFGDERIETRRSHRRIVSAPLSSQGVDYGMIIKIHPKSNPERTWICCAGFGEWGTSGAAWFLANRWKKIHKFAKRGPFACITETRIGSDDSTVMSHRFRNEEEVEAAAKNVELADNSDGESGS